MPIPAARVLRYGRRHLLKDWIGRLPRLRGHLYERVRALFAPAVPHLHIALMYVIGLAPILAVVLLAVAFVILAGLNASP